jgi:undecaprenyl-diphosphatase
MIHFLHHCDTVFFLFLNHTIANPVFDTVFPLITNGSFWVIPGVAAALVFLYFQKRRGALVLALMVVTVSVSDPVCNRVIKQLVPRMRPSDQRVHIEGGRFLIGRKDSRSFPSSHAMNMFAQAMLLTLLYRRKWVGITAFSFAAVIGFSRIYVGVHWPFDVLAGAVFGAITGVLVYYAFRFMRKKLPKASPLNPPKGDFCGKDTNHKKNLVSPPSGDLGG